MLSEWESVQQECSLFFHKGFEKQPKSLVFGDGLKKDPMLMLIGEAPGEQEEKEGRPFVGKAGKNLDAFLMALGLSREEIYISNVVKIRPTRMGKTGRICNRPPTQEETAFFLPWLMREVLAVKPKALVTLGNVALHAFLPQKETIGNCHGKWHRAAVQAGEESIVLPLFALYHPASIIYRAELKEVYRKDLEILKNSLAEGKGDDN